MKNNIEIAVDGYVKARERFFSINRAYLDECKKARDNMVILTEESEIFLAIREVISWAVALYERIDKQKILAIDKHFMSGIKYIDNVIKHENTKFSFYTILRPGINISVEVEGDPNLNIKNVSMDSCILWGDMDEIPTNKHNSSQRKNYNKYVKRQSVCESVEKINDLLRKYYPIQ